MPDEDSILNLEHTVGRVDDDLTSLTKDVEALKKEITTLRDGARESWHALNLMIKLYGSGGANLHDEKAKTFSELKDIILQLSNRFPPEPKK